MTANNVATAAEAEADAERARSGLVTTLDRLRENLQPANVVEEVMSSAKLSASAISDQIWDTARKNPLPALMIGTGLAMIFGLGTRVASKARTAPSPSLPRVVTRPGAFPLPPDVPRVDVNQADRAHRTLNTAYESAKSQAGDLLGTANDRLTAATSKVAAAGRRAVSTIKPAGETMSFNRSSDTLMNGISRVIDEQPLVLAALGVALGAAIGAAIPQTDAENALMGESSHSVRDAAQGLVADQYESLKSTASSAVDGIKQTIAEHGVNADNLSGLVGDVAEKAKAATYDAGRTFDLTKS